MKTSGESLVMTKLVEDRLPAFSQGSNTLIIGMKLLLNPAMIEKICKIISNKTARFPLGFGEKCIT